MRFGDYEDYDGVGLAQLVARREILPAELVEAAIERIEARNGAINAVVRPLYDQAREAAGTASVGGGPLAGVPFLIKDLVISWKGVPTSCGSRLVRDVPAAYDSALLRRYRDAGLIPLGKTNTPEFGLSQTTEPREFGSTRNPWDTGRTSGGSSGGSAAAVAARMVPLAHANDGGGSIRIPAACCGLFGLKPTRARNPLGPRFAELWRGFVAEHVVSRSVRDSAAALDATQGGDIGAPYVAPPPAGSYLDEVGRAPDKLRIAIWSAPPIDVAVDAEVRAAVENAGRKCAALGHHVEEAAPDLDGMDFYRAYLKVVAVGSAFETAIAEDDAGHRARAGDLELATRALALWGRGIAAVDYERAVDVLRLQARRIAVLHQRYDVLITPVIARPPIKLGQLGVHGADRALLALVVALRAGWMLGGKTAIDRLIQQGMWFTPHVALQNVTGQPAMSVPLYWTQAGLPIGVQFVGRYGDEATLFRLAGQLEAAHPWADRRPAIAPVSSPRT